MFRGESRLNISHAEGRVRVCRRKGERCVDTCVLHRNRFGGDCVMVLGSILGGLKTRPFVVHGDLKVQGYINRIFVPEAVPDASGHPANVQCTATHYSSNSKSVITFTYFLGQQIARI